MCNSNIVDTENILFENPFCYTSYILFGLFTHISQNGAQASHAYKALVLIYLVNLELRVQFPCSHRGNSFSEELAK